MKIKTWVDRVMMGFALINIPVGVWLVFFAPAIPRSMHMGDLANAPLRHQMAFLLGGRSSLSAALALATTAIVAVILADKVRKAIAKRQAQRREGQSK